MNKIPQAVLKVVSRHND